MHVQPIAASSAFGVGLRIFACTWNIIIGAVTFTTGCVGDVTAGELGMDSKRIRLLIIYSEPPYQGLAFRKQFPKPHIPHSGFRSKGHVSVSFIPTLS